MLFPAKKETSINEKKRCFKQKKRPSLTAEKSKTQDLPNKQNLPFKWFRQPVILWAVQYIGTASCSLQGHGSVR